jgi:hypothetical protein
MDSTEKRPLMIARGWIQAAAIVPLFCVLIQHGSAKLSQSIERSQPSQSVRM